MSTTRGCTEARLFVEVLYEKQWVTDMSCIKGKKENLYSNSGKALAQVTQTGCESPSREVFRPWLAKTPGNLFCSRVSPPLHGKVGPDDFQAAFPACVIL